MRFEIWFSATVGLLSLGLAAPAAGQACLGTPLDDRALAVAAVGGLNENGPTNMGLEAVVRPLGRGAKQSRYGRTTMIGGVGVRHAIRLELSYGSGRIGRVIHYICPTMGLNADWRDYEEGGPDPYWAWRIPIGVGFSLAGLETPIGTLSPFAVPRLFLRETFFTGERIGPDPENVVGEIVSPGTIDHGLELGASVRRSDLFAVIGARATWDAPSPDLFLKLGWAW